MTLHKSPASVIASAERTIETAAQGWRDYLEGGERRWSGLLNAITSARMSTNVIQTMRHLVDGFDDWWSAEVQVLNNPTAIWFVEVRNALEHQGTPGEIGAYGVLNLDSGMMAALRSQGPEGTISTFIGDALGRSGWNVQLPDGSVHQVFFSLPKEAVDFGLVIEGAPDEKRLEELFPVWFEQVSGLVAAAGQRFL